MDIKSNVFKIVEPIKKYINYNNNGNYKRN